MNINPEVVIYAARTYRMGTPNFCKHVGDRAHIAVTDEDVRRIAERSIDADEFVEIFNNDATWRKAGK